MLSSNRKFESVLVARFLKPMEAPGRAVSNNVDEERALRGLLDVFGSNVSAEQIVSTFCEAGKNAEVSGQILFDMLGTSSNIDVMQNSNHDVSNKASSVSNMTPKLSQPNGNPKSSRMKCSPASVGAVSNFLGKEYVRSNPLATGSPAAEKPMKLNAELLPMSEISGNSKMDATKDDCMHKELEDFLFQILGQGFQLDRNTIADTLRKCGYDMQKSMDKLFNHSASLLDRRMSQVEDSSRKHRDCHTFTRPKKMQQQENSYTGDSRRLGRNHLQKEVLFSLFTVPERDEELPLPIPMQCNKRFNVVTPLVDEPPKIETAEVNLPEDNNVSVEEDKYKLLRKAVLEHRDTMREYQKAGIEAFKKGDHDLANKLKEKVQFFKTKADEAHEESSRMTFGNKNEEDSSSVMTLDVHEFDPKDALRTLKQHILNLAGPQSFKYLKVIIQHNHEDDPKGARKRWIMKLLERDSIEWIEVEGSGGTTIKIPLENLDSKQLSFAKK